MIKTIKSINGEYEAVQYDGTNIREVHSLIEGTGIDVDIFIIRNPVRNGDWAIRIDGNIYICKENAFDIAFKVVRVKLTDDLMYKLLSMADAFVIDNDLIIFPASISQPGDRGSLIALIDDRMSDVPHQICSGDDYFLEDGEIKWNGISIRPVRFGYYAMDPNMRVFFKE